MISIIIPVYNVELYIAQCIDSIILQTYSNFELILIVDNNSSDDSENICWKYANKDKRVRVINSPHLGLGGARNLGLSVSNGEYVQFIDGDDFIPHDALETFMNLMHDDVEIVFGRYTSYYTNPETYIDENSIFDENTYRLTGEESYVKQLKINNVPLWTAWRFISKKSLYNNLGHGFQDNIYAEDLQFVPHLLLSAKKIAFTNKIVYYYRRNREGSLVITLNEKRFIDSINVIKEWLILMNDINCSFDFKDFFTQQLARTYAGLLSSLYYFPRKRRISILYAFKKIEILLNNQAVNPIIRYSYRFLGLRITCIILNIRLRIIRILKK